MPYCPEAPESKGDSLMHDAPRPTLSDLSPEELRTRADEYATMAATARPLGTPDALLKLASSFNELAAEREAADRSILDRRGG
jgi:hypothetical protein